MSRMREGSWSRKVIDRRAKSPTGMRYPVFARVVGEPWRLSYDYPTSRIRRFATDLRRNPTASEIRLEIIIRHLNGGALKERYRSQHVISGRWIVDFFFPEVRLAVEVDGSVHELAERKAGDIEKAEDCRRFDITLLRLTNREVWGPPEKLIKKLREGWREALHRRNRLVGGRVASNRPQRFSRRSEQ